MDGLHIVAARSEFFRELAVNKGRQKTDFYLDENLVKSNYRCGTSVGRTWMEQMALTQILLNVADASLSMQGVVKACVPAAL